MKSRCVAEYDPHTCWWKAAPQGSITNDQPKAIVYQLHENGQFPRSVKITGRAVGWVEEEVQRWLAERRDGRS
jgi:hypothetical protein